MKIEVLDKELNSLFKKKYNNDLDYTETVFLRLKEFRKLYLDTLLFSLRNKIDVTELAKNSYKHDNGFFKLTLFDTIDKKYKVRIHYWANPFLDSPKLQNIHNHRFGFFSLILKGELQNRTWIVSNSDGIKCGHFKYLPRMGEKTYSLAYTKDICLSDKGIAKYGVGDIYHMSSQELHTIGINTNSVVTLFLEERSRITEYADVYSLRYPKKDFPIDSPSLSPEQYKETISKILLLINNL